MTGDVWFAGLPEPLARLAEELLLLGLGVEARLSAEGAFLKVWHPGLVVTGLSVWREREAAEGTCWFRVCGGRPLAPCDDAPRAAVRIHEVLESLAADSRGPLEAARGPAAVEPSGAASPSGALDA